MTTAGDTAGVLAPPPVIVGVTFLLGLAADRWLHTPPLVSSPPLRWGLAAGLAVTGAALGIGALWAFRKAQTNVLPDHPTLAITGRGPYRLTRNPMYLGLGLLYAAAALAVGGAITLALLPLAMIILHFGVVLREERYLAGKFGEAYLRYKRSVRRWI